MIQVSDVLKELRTFEINFNSSGRIYKNLAFSIGKSINVAKHQKFPTIFLLDIRKTSSGLYLITIMLLYRRPNSLYDSFHCTKTMFSFSKCSKKMVLPKKIPLEYDLSCIIRKYDICFSRKYHLTL